MTQTQPAVDLLQIDLGVTGMTCTSCSSRVERKLNKLDGVEASVNFATESASVSYDPNKVDPDKLIETVKATGYGAFTMAGADDTPADTGDDGDPASPASEGSGAQGQVDAAREHEAADLKKRLIISALLTVPIVLLSMIPALQFTHWQWAVLTMTTPVFFWGGAPFHRATLVNLRHGAFTMDTLITLGTTAVSYTHLTLPTIYSV